MATRYAVASGDWSSTSVWSATSGGSPGASVPGATDDVVFDSNSNGFSVVSSVANQQCNNLTASGTCGLAVSGGRTLTINGTTNLTGYTGTMGSPPGVLIIFKGDLTIGSGMNMISLVPQIAGNCHLTTNGATMFGLTMTSIVSGITLTLMDDYTGSGQITNDITGGTLDAATHNVNVTTTNFESLASAGCTTNMGSGTWTITGNVGTLWFVNSADTINAGTSLLKFTGNLSADRIFRGGGKTYYNVENATTGGHALVINDSGNTFHNFTADAGSQTKILASSTQTATAWAFNGTSGSGCVLGSSSGGTPATIVQSSGTVIATYTTISDSTASGGALFIARNSTNGGGNTGWSFSLPAANQAYII